MEAPRRLMQEQLPTIQEAYLACGLELSILNGAEMNRLLGTDEFPFYQQYYVDANGIMSFEVDEEQ